MPSFLCQPARPFGLGANDAGKSTIVKMLTTLLGVPGRPATGTHPSPNPLPQGEGEQVLVS